LGWCRDHWPVLAPAAEAVAPPLDARQLCLEQKRKSVLLLLLYTVISINKVH
jgi:hypothetical protein